MNKSATSVFKDYQPKHTNMTRTITLTDVHKAVEAAYAKHRHIESGAIDARVANISQAGQFAISVTLADGRHIDIGDTDAQFPIGGIVNLPVSLVLLAHQGFKEKSGKACKCECNCGSRAKSDSALPFCPHSLRAISAIVPQGDPEGKFGILNDMVTNMCATVPEMDEELYKYYHNMSAAAVKLLSDAGETLYDDAAQTVDIYSRLISLKIDTRHLSIMGGTLAADGKNPATGEYIFADNIAAPAVAFMATHGKHFIRHWMLRTGLPARKNFAGAILAIMPGFGAIAAYAPEVDEHGCSIKAAKAIEMIAHTLGLNIFASSRVEVAFDDH